jgi:transposase
MPVRLELTTGEAHDNQIVTELLSDLKSGAMLLADRWYDADWIRAFAQCRRVAANARRPASSARAVEPFG